MRIIFPRIFFVFCHKFLVSANSGILMLEYEKRLEATRQGCLVHRVDIEFRFGQTHSFRIILRLESLLHQLQDKHFQEALHILLKTVEQRTVHKADKLATPYDIQELLSALLYPVLGNYRHKTQIVAIKIGGQRETETSFFVNQFYAIQFF